MLRMTIEASWWFLPRVLLVLVLPIMSSHEVLIMPVWLIVRHGFAVARPECRRESSWNELIEERDWI